MVFKVKLMAVASVWAVVNRIAMVTTLRALVHVTDVIAVPAVHKALVDIIDGNVITIIELFQRG